MSKKEKDGKIPLKDTIAEIKKQFGDDAIMMMDEKPDVDVEPMPTGSVGLDDAIGIGGFPRGRVVEVYGPESSGKTTLALHVIAEAQKKGGSCAFIDAEHAMDPQYAKRIGVKVEDVLISQPSSGEEGMQIVDQLVRGGSTDVVVIDSVAALTPRAEIEGQIGDVKVGAQARLMSQSLRVLTGSIAKGKTLVIFINQVRANIGGFGGFGAPAETTAGGKALKFYASVRVDLRKIATLKNKEEPIGSRIKAKVVKNKVAPPFKVTEFDVMYNEGISHEGELLALGEKYGVIVKTGSTYKYHGEKIAVGYDASKDALKDNKVMASKVLTEIKVKMES